MRVIHLAVVLLLAPFVTWAEEVRVDRIDVVGKGIYIVTTGEETPDASAPTGKLAAVTAVENIEATTAIPGKVGLEFGLQYVVVGEPAGAEVSLDFVGIFPPPGLIDPADPTPLLETRYSRVKKIGETVYLGYGFENDWEIVSGTWTFEIWHAGKKLATESFSVSK
jgi:hypothetical protein